MRFLGFKIKKRGALTSPFFVSANTTHVKRCINHAIGKAPLIIIPRQDTTKRLIDDLCLRLIKG